MTRNLELPTYDLREGDCLPVLRSLEWASVDAMVTDPPAGIGFMGKAWDSDKGGRDEWIAWLENVMREAIRVLKPGAHALVWALPRTSHWTATALENAGFEIRDRVSHLFGTGFPKHHGALKPACEDWWLCRKPLEGTVASNVAAHGTGGLNVDGCRIEGGKRSPGFSGSLGVIERSGSLSGAKTPRANVDESQGRWPSNVLFDTDAAAELDEQSGERRPERARRAELRGGSPDRVTFNPKRGAKEQSPHDRGDGGGASRFFYVAKPSKTERGKGNTHPTVKSVALMRWLCRLITPQGGLVLDPFMGSGTTGVAALAEGFSFLGIEREPAYLAIARKRIAGASPLLSRRAAP